VRSLFSFGISDIIPCLWSGYKIHITKEWLIDFLWNILLSRPKIFYKTLLSSHQSLGFYRFAFFKAIFISCAYKTLSQLSFSSAVKDFILTRPAFFPFEHRRTESVCYYAIKSLFDVLYLDMWHTHYTRDVTIKNKTRWQ
jgi:hypothetical protein